MFSFFKKKPSLQESSTGFDMEHLEPFLLRVANLIPDGFGPNEVAQVMAMARGMEHDEEKDQEFRIQFAGRPATLHIKVFMDDIDAPDVYFFSPPGLAVQIDAEMRAFFEELGI